MFAPRVLGGQTQQLHRPLEQSRATHRRILWFGRALAATRWNPQEVYAGYACRASAKIRPKPWASKALTPPKRSNPWASKALTKLEYSKNANSKLEDSSKTKPPNWRSENAKQSSNYNSSKIVFDSGALLQNRLDLEDSSKTGRIWRTPPKPTGFGGLLQNWPDLEDSSKTSWMWRTPI